jgi:hypothetical protein
MHSRLSSLGVSLMSLLLGAVSAGCAGGALGTSHAVTSPVAPPDAFECIREQIKKVGFRQTSYDTDELRVAGLQYDESVRRPDVQFRRLVHRVQFEVSPTAEGTTSITAEAATFAELTTHRGPTEEQEKTSPKARDAAETVLQHCSAPVDSTKVPG